MKVALLVLLLISPFARAAQPDYCERPYEAICKATTNEAKSASDANKVTLKKLALDANGGVPLDQLLKEIGAARKEFEDAQDAKDPSALVVARKKLEIPLQKYAAILNKVQDWIAAELRKKGTSEQEILTRVRQIQKNVGDAIHATPAFQATTNGIGPNQIANAVLTTDIVTARTVAGAPVQHISKALNMFDSCGIDGLLPQASHVDAPNPYFYLCPGFFLRVLENHPNDQVSFIVAHELGHGIDPESTRRDPKKPLETNNDPFTTERYDAFLKCVETYYSDQFTSPEVVSQYVTEKGLPALREHFKQLNTATPRNEERILFVRDLLAFTERKPEELASRQRWSDSYFPPKASAVRCHASELCADVFGETELANRLASKADADPWQTFAGQFKALCPEDEALYRMRYGPANEDGSHPKIQYRIEAALRNPKIRAALGCRPLNRPDDKPHCTLGGPEKFDGTVQPASGAPAPTQPAGAQGVR